MVICSRLPAQKLISVSGIVEDAAEGRPIPFANIVVKGTTIGVSTSTAGFFSMVARPADTIIFSAVGYRQCTLPVPGNLGRLRWSVVVTMVRDTLQLRETEVYPWPSPQKFKAAFMALEINEPKMKMGYMPPGLIRKLDTTIPVNPNPILNPASFMYEEVVLELLKRMPKRKRAGKLPAFE